MHTNLLAVVLDGSMSPGPMTSTAPSPLMSPDATPMSTGSDAMDTTMMSMSGPDLLPPLVTWLWLAALAAVLVLHCSHLVRAGGQHRWFHASHILMLVSMLYMYASMEFHWKWLPAGVQAAAFGLSSLAIAIWMVSRLVRRMPFSYLWILAVVMQAAMAYMWLPEWLTALTWALVVYYGLETLAWLLGLVNDTNGRGTVGPGDRSVFVALAHPSRATNVSMAVMAASMGYMFAAMQLMR